MKDRVADSRQRAATGALGLDGWEIAIRAAFRLVADVTLRLERLQRGQHRGIREVFLESVPHLGDADGAEQPEDANDGELAWRKIDVGHGRGLVSTAFPVE